MRTKSLRAACRNGSRHGSSPYLKHFPIARIKADKPYRRLDQDWVAQLKPTILATGLLAPIVVLPDGTLVVGFHRFEACKQLGWKTIPAIVLSVRNILEARLDENIFRKDFTLRERARVANAILEQKILEAKKRRNGRLKRGTRIPDPEIFQERGEAFDLAAKRVGLGGRQLRKINEMEREAKKHSAVEGMLVRADELDKVNGLYKSMKSFLLERSIVAEMPKKISASKYRLAVDEMNCADVTEILPAMANHTFDAILWDTPYGVGIEYDGWTEINRKPEEYWAWLEPIYRQLYRMLKPGGYFAIFQSQCYYPYLWEWFGRDIRIFIAAREWLYFNSGERLIHSYDPVVCFYKPGGPKLVPSGRGRAKDFFASKMKFDRLAHYSHPCPKALDVCRYLIENFVARNALILDPMCGIGSICIAAKLCGRHFVGFDQSRKYVAIARKRMALLTDWETVERLSTKGNEDERLTSL